MGPLVAGLIAGAGSLLGSLGSAGIGYKQSKSLMRYQAELNQQAVDSANVYNSPIEQMKRLRQAGLNPNLVYGNGVTGNQSDAKSVGIANRNVNLDTGLVEAVKQYFAGQQISNENRRTEQDIRESLARQANIEAKTLGEILKNKVSSATLGTQIKQASANLAHTLMSTHKTNQDINESVQKVSNLQSIANLLQEQIRYWDAHATNESVWKPKEFEARVYQLLTSGQLNEAQIGVAKSLESLNYKKIEQLRELILGIQLENGDAAIDYELKKGMQGLGLNGFKPKDLLEVIKLILNMSFK